MGEWVHRGESIGDVAAVVVSDTDVTVRAVDDVVTYARENMNLDTILKSLPPHVTVIRDV